MHDVLVWLSPCLSCVFFCLFASSHSILILLSCVFAVAISRCSFSHSHIISLSNVPFFALFFLFILARNLYSMLFLLLIIRRWRTRDKGFFAAIRVLFHFLPIFFFFSIFWQWHFLPSLPWKRWLFLFLLGNSVRMEDMYACMHVEIK